MAIMSPIHADKYFLACEILHTCSCGIHVGFCGWRVNLGFFFNSFFFLLFISIFALL